jgi:hypothetical protein
MGGMALNQHGAVVARHWGAAQCHAAHGPNATPCRALGLHGIGMALGRQSIAMAWDGMTLTQHGTLAARQGIRIAWQSL